MRICLAMLYVFPAPAGVILITVEGASWAFSFPRTCGGDPDSPAGSSLPDRFSPHLRG